MLSTIMMLFMQICSASPSPHFPSFPISLSLSQACVREAILAQLDLRWVELNKNHIIDVLFLIKDPPESLLRHIETRILELSETMTVKQLLTILGLICESGKANVPLMKGVCYHLSKNATAFTFEQASKVSLLLDRFR